MAHKPRFRAISLALAERPLFIMGSALQKVTLENYELRPRIAACYECRTES